jgi:hypothetical protein
LMQLKNEQCIGTHCQRPLKSQVKQESLVDSTPY